ncbi:MAG TPA: protein translocase subunit SecD [Candidatus Omnitrophota bacterium]|nr:protein translocase subunit SecD [Candidatus Omnitrophota bacterium]HRY85057.1 protein translocase subunit SecD [Candidatus Omnitrophota bacterium]
MDKNYKWKVLLIIGLVAFSLWKAYPPSEKINLGLDLQGGVQLLLQVEMDKVPEEARKDVTARVAEIIRNRIDEFGVKEPEITTQGKDQVVVKLPGVTDRERAKEIAGKAAHLEFKIVSEDTELIQKAEEGTIPPGFEYKKVKGSPNEEMVLLALLPVLTGEHLTTASVGFDQYGQAIVQLTLDKEGGKIFDKVTFQNIGKRLAIVLDGQVYSAPVIRDRIPNGKAQISGNFKAAEASDLALVLRAGALPAPVTVVEERTVGPSLGKDSIDSGIRASIFGLLFVIVFMPVYYLLCGWIANLGLLVYVILVVGSMATMGSTLTLPGIAGFILSIGMAVDANVLIFERMREEMATGKTARAVVSAGFHRALSAIIDSNITTLITAALLFIFGTGPIQGFAVTLSIGLVASLFSAIFVTRVVFDHVVKKNPNKVFKMLEIFKSPNIPFLKGRFWAYGFSVICIVLGISAFVLRGSENYGVEFTGGTLVQITFKDNINQAKFRDQLEKQGLKAVTLQRYGEARSHQYIVKMTEGNPSKVSAAAEATTGKDTFTIEKVDQIGPSVSGSLRDKAFWAIVWSWLGILIYVGWRFEWKFATAAVIALVHDTLFSFGVYVLSGREVNLATVAAIMTIIGFSVNDTIVIFDRVRDNLKLMRKTPFVDIVNLSVNQCLSRTILTTMTVLFGALALLFFGGAAISDFAFILTIGFLIGTYSTVFVASALVVDWKAH